MRPKKTLICLLLILMYIECSSQYSINGLITDFWGNPIQSVVIESPNKKNIKFYSDSNGYYRIDGINILRFTKTGYKIIERKISNDTTINVILTDGPIVYLDLLKFEFKIEILKEMNKIIIKESLFSIDSTESCKPKYNQEQLNNFYDFLKHNLIYPDKAITDEVEGKVILHFITDSNGKIQEVHVSRKLCSEVDITLTNVIKSAPELKSEEKSIINATYFVLPINFKLNIKTIKPEKFDY